ncbi:MAG TPA: LPXTG cell wall anchor domain-containing protein [Pseudolysinimonas sp.]|jgi:LPXTG-motif cell wall-anchored protein
MGMGVVRRLPVAVLAAAAAVALVVWGGPNAPSAHAATPPVGSFPVWAQTSPSSFTGQLSSALGGGVIAVTTTGTGARIAESGTASFLGATTGFGQRFGSSRYQSYLTIGLAPTVPPATHGADSVTTVTLPALPAGWGFAVGDIDADMVSIDAIGGGSDPGGALTASELGAQDTGGTPLLNYCNNASPKPGSCGPGMAFPDHPFWCDTGAAAGPPCAPATRPRTVVGSGSDTAGSYDWFVPTVPVTTLTLTYQWLLGSPTFQLWIVAPAPAATVSGTILQPSGAAAPAGTVVLLEDAAGDPIEDLQDQPVSIPVAADGTFSFATEFGGYRLVVDPPEGFAAPPPFAFTAGTDPVALPALALTAILPATGTDARPLFALAGVLLVLGAVLGAVSLLRRRGRSQGRGI